jgi:hypothetical protein
MELCEPRAHSAQRGSRDAARHDENRDQRQQSNHAVWHGGQPVPQRRRRADQRQAGGECDGG